MRLMISLVGRSACDPRILYTFNHSIPAAGRSLFSVDSGSFGVDRGDLYTSSAGSGAAGLASRETCLLEACLYDDGVGVRLFSSLVSSLEHISCSSGGVNGAWEAMIMRWYMSMLIN